MYTGLSIFFLRFSDSQKSKNPYFLRMFPYVSCIVKSKLTVIGRVTGPYFDKILEVPESSKKYWDRSGIDI